MTLPVLLSIPHGGDRVPPEAAPHSALTPADIFSDGDACTREIYDLGDAVVAVHRADIARAFVDLNRAPDVRPPENPDGFVKSLTADRIPVWRGGGPPPDDLAETLLERYWHPYHDRLADLAADPAVRVAFDCHSMAEFAPAIAPRPGEPRPAFCLSNANGATAPDSLLEALADAFADAFDCPRDEIRLNDPFQGGHITRSHGAGFGEGGTPWVQIEMNRRWYLADPWYDRATNAVHPDRLKELRERFRAAVEALSESVLRDARVGKT